MLTLVLLILLSTILKFNYPQPKVHTNRTTQKLFIPNQ